MRKLGLIFSIAIISSISASQANAGSKGYHVGKSGEFLPMRCTINGTPRNSVFACRAAAHRVHKSAGWSQAAGPGVPAYYETGVPTPRHGMRHTHNQPVMHEHRGRHGSYRHYGYLGHHHNKPVPGAPNRIVHTGGSQAGYIIGHVE